MARSGSCPQRSFAATVLDSRHGVTAFSCRFQRLTTLKVFELGTVKMGHKYSKYCVG
jgi:hypothetical protein